MDEDVQLTLLTIRLEYFTSRCDVAIPWTLWQHVRIIAKHLPEWVITIKKVHVSVVSFLCSACLTRWRCNKFNLWRWQSGSRSTCSCILSRRCISRRSAGGCSYHLKAICNRCTTGVGRYVKYISASNDVCFFNLRILQILRQTKTYLEWNGFCSSDSFIWTGAINNAAKFHKSDVCWPGFQIIHIINIQYFPSRG